MSFGIIIKGKNSSRSSLRFKSHFNRSIVSQANPHGTYIHTKDQYLKELKDKNLVPYRKDDYKHKEPDIKISDEAHSAVEHIRQTKGRPGSGFYNWLEKKGMGLEKIRGMKEKAIKYTKGGKNGFQNGD